MRSYCSFTAFDIGASSVSCHTVVEAYSPFAETDGAPGMSRRTSGFNFKSLHSCSIGPPSDRWAPLRRMESPGWSFSVYCSSRMYAVTNAGIIHSCSGVSSSTISAGIGSRSSSWQTRSVRAVPMGFCAVNFVGFGSTNTASSGLSLSHRLPTCSTRPMPVVPRQVPADTSAFTIWLSTGTANILTKISSWSRAFFTLFAFTCTCVPTTFEPPKTCCTGPWWRILTASSAALKRAVFMKSLSVITISLWSRCLSHSAKPSSCEDGSPTMR
mmetsp:Transcript_65783/g.122662  ORF Transcript_65783/g.122662 Transcript_65783/m.122662 type:complete len:270 (-) Transcript_65783:388-1197(-)